MIDRMLRFTEDENGLSSNQYGFRKGRSTVDAILPVTKTAEKALDPIKRRGIRFCAVVTLDVRNAFNSASWSAIADAPQGSILGPVLWNVMYDEVLRLEYPVGVEIV